jgi:hypothetical protein
MVEVAVGRFDGNIVGRQPDVGVGAVIVLMDVQLQFVGLGGRLETKGQHGEGSDGHVVAVVSYPSGALILRRVHDLGSGLAILVRDRNLRVAVVRLVLSTSPVLDVVAIAIFTLHDVMDGARGAYSRS